MKPGILSITGRWAHSHRRVVLGVWGIGLLALAFFAPQLQNALSGAMWEVNGSESLTVREALDKDFGGLSSQSAVVILNSETLAIDDPAFQARIGEAQGILDAIDAFAAPVPPQPLPDGHTVMLQAGALVNPTEAVRAAEDLGGELEAINDDQITVALTGSPSFWADFNQMNEEGMQKAELLTWPVTAVILVLAFGTLAAAGLPLLLTAAGLVSAMGVLYGVTRVTDLSVWTLNFAMMFALALGIDYSLFIVSRFRNAIHAAGDNVSDAIGETMDTAGKAVLFSGATVIISLSAVLLVPIPAFQSMAAGMMLSVGFVLLAAMTLLPAVIGPWIDRAPLPWHKAGDHRSPTWERFAAAVQKRPLVAGGVVLGLILLMASPLLTLETGMPGISVLGKDSSTRQGYDLLSESFGPGGPGPIQVIVPASEDAQAVADTLADTPGIAAVFPAAQGADGSTLITVLGTADPSTPEAGDFIGELRGELPSSVLVGGPVAENYDLDQTLREKAPVVIGVVLLLGFVLLLFALQALFMAAAGVVLNLLSVAAGFGIGSLIFQHGIGSEVLGFESQGYLTSWAPLFFFALIFALSMDYTVFLLASTREHFERSGDPDEAVRSSVAHTARPIIAAAGVMVAVFTTFALAGTLPMKEMGLILAVAVLVDAALVRLVLVPALLRITGRAAWWLPGWIDRFLPDVCYAH